MPQTTFIFGGAASGKSAWAEEYIKNKGLSLTYLATGQVYDAEMAAKIKLHQDRRDSRWRTIEAPLDLAGPLDELTPQDAVLIDCATMWLSNHLLAEHDLPAMQDALIDTLSRCSAHWVVVSNEVGQGIVPDNAMARQFREAQGRLNIALAAAAQTVVQVTVGLPVVLKGTL